MKTVSIVIRSAVAVCFAFVMSSASCELFDKVDDVTVPIELEHVFHVNETANGSNVVYAKYQLLDAADVNDDFDKYKSKIKSITITSVQYQITNVAQADIIFTNGKAGFSAISTTSISGVSSSDLASLGIENIKAAENQTKNLDYSQAGVDEFADLLKSDYKVNVWLTGTFAKTPAQFDVKVIVKANITADAL